MIRSVWCGDVVDRDVCKHCDEKVIRWLNVARGRRRWVHDIGIYYGDPFCRKPRPGYGPKDQYGRGTRAEPVNPKLERDDT